MRKMLRGSEFELAVRTVNCYDGWPRVISDDWINQARSICERKARNEIVVLHTKLKFAGAV